MSKKGQKEKAVQCYTILSLLPSVQQVKLPNEYQSEIRRKKDPSEVTEANLSGQPEHWKVYFGQHKNLAHFGKRKQLAHIFNVLTIITLLIEFSQIAL